MSGLLETHAPSPRNVPDPPRFGPRQFVQLIVGVLILGALGWAIHDWFAARKAAASPIACQFLNAVDVSVALGTPVEPGVRDTPDDDYEHPNSLCRFTLPARHTSVSLYVRWSDAAGQLQTHARGVTENRKTIQEPGVTGFSGTFLGGQFAFLVRQHHFFEVWTSSGSGSATSVEKLALLAAARDHALND